MLDDGIPFPESIRVSVEGGDGATELRSAKSHRW
jgi:hypothetical protein